MSRTSAPRRDADREIASIFASPHWLIDELMEIAPGIAARHLAACRGERKVAELLLHMKTGNKPGQSLFAAYLSGDSELELRKTETMAELLAVPKEDRGKKRSFKWISLPSSIE